MLECRGITVASYKAPANSAGNNQQCRSDQGHFFPCFFTHYVFIDHSEFIYLLVFHGVSLFCLPCLTPNRLRQMAGPPCKSILANWWGFLYIYIYVCENCMPSFPYTAL